MLVNHLNITRLYSTAILCFVVCYCHGQGLRIKGARGGLTAATNGFGIDGAVVFENKNIDRESGVCLSFQTLRTLNETKIQNPYTTNPKSYVLGKVNAASTLRLSFFWDRMLGVSGELKPTVLFGVGIGPSLGILKPYYIGYQDPEKKDNQPQVIVQNQETLENQNYIYGPANWTQGLKELSFLPGMHLDAHLNVTWNQSFYSQQWKTGVRLDYFPNGLNILYNSDNQMFTSVYVAFFIGT